MRGSAFHAIAAPCHTEHDARELLASREKLLFDASHHCSAWRLRTGEWRANDSGEPAGSAGAPILAALDGAGLTDCAVVVTRYFGGTKLGVGGLIRAYGDAAALALKDAPRLVGSAATRVRLTYSYENTGIAMRAVEAAGAHNVVQGFSDRGSRGEVEFTLPASLYAEISDSLRARSAGALVLEVLDERVLYTPTD